MRTCMLLPIKDDVDGAVAFDVFKGLEDYFKNSEWCYYRSNSEILNILSSYKSNLHTYLENEEVLRTLAGKIRAGSLVKVKLESTPNGMQINLEIIGDNGKDIYFKETGIVDQRDSDLFIRTVINWLEVYERSIPYDGRVIGVLGNQFTIDIGKSYFVRVGDALNVIRPLSKKSHPLLQEVVEWETELLGNGKIINVSESQASAMMEDYRTRKKIGVGDWILFKRDEQPAVEKIQYPEVDEQEFGKLGTLSAGIKLASGSDTNVTSGTNRKISGLIYGIYGKALGYVTRHWWGSLELERNFGSYSQSEGTVTLNSNSVSQGVWKVKGGYKYLPLGFFYGPQVDFYLGYASYSYSLDKQVSEGYGDHKFSGILFGFQGEAPIYKQIRVFLKLDAILNPGYDEDSSIYGEKDSSSSYQVEAGARYTYSSKITLDGSLELTSNKATFGNGDEVHFRETGLRLGATFGF